MTHGTGSIYVITCSPNDKVYVGQTVRSVEYRFEEHVYNALVRDFRTPIHCAIRKYGRDAFRVESVEKDLAAPDELDEREVHWIAHHNSTDRAYGYNIGEGGRNGGGNMTDEVRARISATKTGVKLGSYSDERRAAISAGKLASGYRHSAETRALIATRRRPYVTSEKTRELLRAAAQVNKTWSTTVEQVEEIVDRLLEGQSQLRIAREMEVGVKPVHWIAKGHMVRPEADHALGRLPVYREAIG